MGTVILSVDYVENVFINLFRKSYEGVFIQINNAYDPINSKF